MCFHDTTFLSKKQDNSLQTQEYSATVIESSPFRCYNRYAFRQTVDCKSNFQFARERYGERMRILYELSWLWETLVIVLAAAAVCVVCAMLICKAVKKNFSKKTAAVIGAAAFAGAVLAVIVIARTPMPL